MKKQKITKRDIQLYNEIPKWIENNKKWFDGLKSKQLLTELICLAPLLVMACAVLLYIIQ